MPIPSASGSSIPASLDSVGATGQTKVAVLPKTDSAYSYPATYPGTYDFGLAVRNTSGRGAPSPPPPPIPCSQGVTALTDTIYVDSAIGTTTDARRYPAPMPAIPATPLTEIEDAVWCAQASGFVPNDTLVVRVMPGTYSGIDDNEFDPPSTYPVVITSFDANSRAVLSSPEQGRLHRSAWAANTTLRRMDVAGGHQRGGGRSGRVRTRTA